MILCLLVILLSTLSSLFCFYMTLNFILFHPLCKQIDFSCFLKEYLIVIKWFFESYKVGVFGGVFTRGRSSRLHFYLNEIKALSYLTQVSFSHVYRRANGLADSLTKQGVHRVRLRSSYWVIFFGFIVSL